MKNRRSGFSFPETVIAIVLLLLGILMLGSLYPVSFKNLTRSKQITTATLLAQTKLEEALTHPNSISNPEEGSFPENSEFKYKITKEPLSWSNKLKQLKVEVYRLVEDKPVIDCALAQLVPGQSPAWEVRIVSGNFEGAPSDGHTDLTTYNSKTPIIIPAQGGLFIDEVFIYSSKYSATIKNISGGAINVPLELFLGAAGVTVYIDGNQIVHRQQVPVNYAYFPSNPISILPGQHTLDIIVDDLNWRENSAVRLVFPVFSTQGIDFISAP
ncbi:MAG: hypothetical protein HYU63_07190 [Armatimonadetes bacterium]|nr:hypothetical protein [Armatimonadota bacterium]